MVIQQPTAFQPPAQQTQRGYIVRRQVSELEKVDIKAEEKRKKSDENLIKMAIPKRELSKREIILDASTYEAEMIQAWDNPGDLTGK